MSRRKAARSRLYLQVFWLALGALVLSFTLNLSFERLSQSMPLSFSVPLLVVVVLLGVAGDAVGIASTRAKEERLLSMASRQVGGAKEAVWFVRNAPGISSVFSDLVGDVSATLSGALAVAMVFRLRALFPSLSSVFLTSAAVGLASLFSVGGKALFKPFALKYAEDIILLLGKIRRTWLRVTGLGQGGTAPNK